MTFTLEDVLNATRAVVAEKGEDYVYSNSVAEGGNGSCVYANEDGTPSCLVGHVIHRLDPEVFKRLAKDEAESGSQVALDLIPAGYIPEGFWEESAEHAMQEVQIHQDIGRTWGEALKTAER